MSERDVGVMAYNEEANIKRTLLALLEQLGEKTGLREVIVVASGCTDNVSYGASAIRRV